MTADTEKTKLNPTKIVNTMMLRSILEHDRARIGGASQKMGLMALDLQKFDKKVKVVFTEAFKKPIEYEPRSSRVQSLWDMMTG